MPETFRCPNCGAPLEYSGPDPTIKCPYCHTPVIVPEALRGGKARAGALDEVPGIADVLSDVTRLAGPLAEIGRLVRSGKKIEAVKLYRETFNVGLQEAKDAVDKIERGEPVTMTNVTVDRVQVGEPVVTTDVAMEPLAPVRTARTGGQGKRAIFASFATTVLFLGVCLVAFYAMGTLLLRLHPVYRTAMELVKNDPAVIEIFGSPVQDGPFASGTIKGFPVGSHTVNLQVAIRGPRAHGMAYIYGDREKDGTCRILSIRIEIGGEEVLKYSGEPEKGFQFSPTAARTGILPTPEYASIVLQFGGEGIGPGWFQDARSIALDGAGHIYVAEYEGGRVQVFDPTGAFVTQWTVGDSETQIYDMAADRRGTVYVAAHGAILRVEGTTGRLLGELEPPDERYWFEQVALMPDGGLVAMDWHNNLVRFDAEGRVAQEWHDLLSSVTGETETVCDLAVDGLGNIFIVGVSDPTIFKFTPEGRFADRFGGEGDAPGQFRTPSVSAMAVDNQGRVYVADFDGIHVFNATGGYLTLFGAEVEGAVRAMVFNAQNELFVLTAAQQVSKFRLNRP